MTPKKEQFRVRFLLRRIWRILILREEGLFQRIIFWGVWTEWDWVWLKWSKVRLLDFWIPNRIISLRFPKWSVFYWDEWNLFRLLVWMIWRKECKLRLLENSFEIKICFYSQRNFLVKIKKLMRLLSSY